MSAGGVTSVVRTTTVTSAAYPRSSSRGASADPQRAAERRKYKRHFTARDHADRHGQPSGAGGEDAGSARELASNGRRSERERQCQQRRVGKQADVGTEADEHEEHGHKKGDHRLEQFAKGAFATLDEQLRVRILKHEAGREGPDERGQSDGVGRPRQHEAKAQTDAEQSPRCAQLRSLLEPVRRQPGAE